MSFDRDLPGLFMDSRFQNIQTLHFLFPIFKRILCYHIWNNLTWSLIFMYSCLHSVPDTLQIGVQLILIPGKCSSYNLTNNWFLSSAQYTFPSNLLHPTFPLQHKYFNFKLNFPVNISDFCSCTRTCSLVVFLCQKAPYFSSCIFTWDQEYRIFLLNFI